MTSEPVSPIDDEEEETLPHDQSRRDSLIPRKPVASANRVTLSTSSGTHRRTSSHGTLADTESDVSRLSTQLSQDIDESWRPAFAVSNLDTAYHGANVPESDITEQASTTNKLRVQEYPLISVQERDLSPKGSGVHSLRECNWLPKGLRWQFLLFLFIITLGLGLLVLGLMIHSQRNQGLGDEQNKPIFLFGWRFTPTLVAVIYTLLVVTMISDIRRTEVYARLSRPNGAPAAITLFYKSRMFWFDPVDALNKKRNNGLRSWALFWASIVNMLGLLVISPFSAALLSPADVFLVQDNSPFHRISTATTQPIQASIDDSILFRSISSLITNTTTSAWLSNDYAVLPFWPADMSSVPFGAILSTAEQEWKANTTVYQTGIDCSTMTLSGIGNFTLNNTVENAYNTTYQVVSNLTSYVLSSEDGCSLGVASYPSNFATDSLFALGAAWWTGGNYSYPPLFGSADMSTFGVTYDAASTVINSTEQCGNRSVILLSPPWSKYGDTSFQPRGHICTSSYYSGNVLVSVSNTGSSSSVTFDTNHFESVKVRVNPDAMNMSSFEAAFLSYNWTEKFQSPDVTGSPYLKQSSEVGGPLVPLGAQYGRNITTMLATTDFLDQARQVKQRFLGESMQTALNNLGIQQAESVLGTTSISQRRIVVNLGAAIILTTLLIISALLIIVVAWLTRLSKRPLNLVQNPTSTVAIASMIVPETATQRLFDGLDRSSEKVMRKQLDGYVFTMRNGVLYAHDLKMPNQRSQAPSLTSSGKEKGSDWRPQLLRGWQLIVFLTLLVGIVAALASIYAKYRNTGLYQRFLVSSVNINLDNTSIQAFAPYSILPTFVAVMVKLWWGSIDETFRRLQPYISLAKNPTSNAKGTTLSYISSPLVWAAVKAGRHRHWLLASVATGALLGEVFTVGMSALWNTNPGVRTFHTTLSRDFELRNVPIIFTVNNPSVHGYSVSADTANSKSTLTSIYGNLLTTWLYGAAVEGSFNATPPSWTKDDWAFVPANLTSVQASASNTTYDSETSNLGPSNNITVQTPALRGRLECIPLSFSNTSAWLNTLDFTNSSAWNDPNIPADLKTGYELKAGLALNESYAGTYSGWDYFDDLNPYTSIFAVDYRMTCCGNETDGEVGQAAVGYWSPAGIEEPEVSRSVIVKWLVGHPFASQFNDSTPLTSRTGDGYESHMHWVWKDIPKVMAYNCTPIFETANASVTVDLASGAVQDYQLLGTPVPDENAWTYNYVWHNVSSELNYTDDTFAGAGYDLNGVFVHNITVSYGYLFRNALLGAANSADTGLAPLDVTVTSENLNDRTFNFRMPGLNVDFMSYTSLALNNNNMTALLDPDTLYKTSSEVFSLFFKHFVQTTVDTSIGGLYMNGSWVLQPRGEVIPSDLGYTEDTILLGNGTTLPINTYLQNTSLGLPQDTQPTAAAIRSTRVEQLDLSPAAFFLCFAILAFLVLILVFILGWHRHYLRLLPRDVDTIGSVLGFVYGSKHFLKLIATNGSGMKSGAVGGRVRLGEFVDQDDGKVRYGVEVVDMTPKQEGPASSPEVVEEKNAGGFLERLRGKRVIYKAVGGGNEREEG
ncbi:hypothetical protein BP6252_08107 [Coleophoma cylindrospora]|uniref:Uncharacterized protein n=1 Tax=Coleophoma cylindrospora TaxID=1849047 RepID=A0A3D8RCE2_9HELO|nr:hypothetical protein BP6252_08107 [Coleophoma cylindrospora]